MPRQTFPFAKSPQPSKQDSTSQVEEPPIVPDEVFRIERPGHPAPARISYTFKLMGLLCIFVMLLAGGFFLMRYLSKNPIVAEAPEDISPARPPLTSPANPMTKSPEPPAGKKNAEPPAPVNREEMEAAKRGADKGLTDFIGAREELDAMGGAHWGGENLLPDGGRCPAGGCPLPEKGVWP